MNKTDLKKMVAHAYEMKAATHETEVVFNIYSTSIYILDSEEDNILSVEFTEYEAIEMCKAFKDCYYKPILIDADSGERVTRKNFMYYDLKSEWVKNHIKQFAAYMDT